MKKTLLSVGILLSTLSMVMGQRYINLNGSTAVGFTAIYPLAADVTTCGYFGGDGVVGTGLLNATKYFTAEYNQNGVQIVKPSAFPEDAGYNKGVYVGITGTNSDCQSVTATSINLSGSANQTLYFVAVNNTANTLNIQALIGDASTGSTNNDYGNTFAIASNASVYSFDYTGKFFCKYSCTTSVGNSISPYTVDAAAINQMYFGVNGGANYDGTDFTIKAVGVGYQTLIIDGSLSTFATTGAIQTVTLTGGILSSNLTVTAPTNFSVSSDGTTYGTTATFSPVAGLLNPTTLYVKYTGTGTSQGNITLAASSILTQNLLASGSVVTDYNAYSISQALVVSPNPSNQGYVDVTSSLNISNIIVVNAQGAQVNASINANRVNTSSLNPGVYTLLIDTEKGRTAKKIIVE